MRPSGGASAAFRRGEARLAVLVVWLVSATAVVPEGLASAYVAGLGGGAGRVAVLMAANPVGNIIGVLFAARVPPQRQAARLLPLAFCVALPLTVCLLDPTYPALVAAVAVSGAGMSVSLLARSVFVASVPDQVRGRAFTVVASGITVGQGLAVSISAAAAQVWSPRAATAGAGVMGVVGLLVIGSARRRGSGQPGPLLDAEIDLTGSSAVRVLSEVPGDGDARG